eukprot:GHVR01139746.1.p1 GENE.GHVR01139746.1~~GHVR01139746.1.p1  ORF type:complete len:150 (+),score=58.43 GHVR01139746.1:22-450(+)
MQYTRFRNIARCAKFRSDGKVFVASDDNGLVQVVDYEKKTPLRRFKGHSGPVHACDFAIDNTHVLSAGDDQNIRMWDITLGDLVWCHPCHSDYIRCMTPLSSPILVEGCLTQTWATGSHDGTVCVMDLTHTHTHTHTHTYYK